ncbi:hypothetical protein GGR57DRAFT_358642 [Xylariaceae sp. FL1272]|nr:hypothetical protein GGR57DRAFT_358642 [Xylariaceae sp. FL1272]
MHFLLLGASGRTGKLVVNEILSQGHTAVALVRNEKSLAPRSGLTIVTGSPLSKPDVEKTFKAVESLTPDAAIMTLNANRKTESPFSQPAVPPRFLADSCANLCAVLEEASVRRVVVMSTVGTGDSWNAMPWLNKIVLGKTNVKYTIEDHNLVDKEIRSTNLDWTLVRPLRLVFDEVPEKSTNEKTDMVTMGSNAEGMRITHSAKISSVAKFLVRAAVEGRFIKQAVVVRD